MAERLIIDALGTEKIIQPTEQVLFSGKKPQVIDEEAILKHLMEARRIAKDMDIGQREATVEVKAQYPELPIFLWLNTDDHLGNVQTDYQAFLRDYGVCKDTPNFFCVSNGDEIDNFMVTLGSWATGVYENPITPEQQAILMQRLFKRLDDQGKLLAMSFGNHNQWIKGAGYKFENTWLSEMSCPILNCGGLLKIKYGSQEYKLAMTHRYWGNSKLNPTNACKRFMDYGYSDADILFLGHTHVAEALYFQRSSKDYRVAVIGGTYKTDDEWASQAGIGRGQEAGLCLKLSPDKRQIEVITSMEQARGTFEVLRDIRRLRPLEDPFA